MDNVDRTIVSVLRNECPNSRADEGLGQEWLDAVIGGVVSVTSTITSGVQETRTARANAQARIAEAEAQADAAEAQRQAELERSREEQRQRRQQQQQAAESAAAGDGIQVSTPWAKIAIGGAAGLVVVGGAVYFLTKAD
jgi:ElaB/YqjD/DUF883 family membrane-anchored ribosome-binding protein